MTGGQIYQSQVIDYFRGDRNHLFGPEILSAPPVGNSYEFFEVELIKVCRHKGRWTQQDEKLRQHTKIGCKLLVKGYGKLECWSFVVSTQVPVVRRQADYNHHELQRGLCLDGGVVNAKLQCGNAFWHERLMVARICDERKFPEKEWYLARISGDVPDHDIAKDWIQVSTRVDRVHGQYLEVNFDIGNEKNSIKFVAWSRNNRSG
ncbi:MAG: hypothetical protein ACR2OR_12425 [Hyphomicrobiales bacterium]